MALSLIHGCQMPQFLHPIIYRSVVLGPEKCTPVIDDVIDLDLRDKLLKVCVLTVI